MQVVFVVAVVVAVVIGAIVRRSDPLGRAAVLRQAGFGLMALSAVVFGAFVIGETVTDPGGWEAAGLVAAWAVPLAGLAVLVQVRPAWAVVALTALTVAMIGVSIWFAADPQGWRSVENRHGPIRTVVTFVLATAIALLGLKRTAAAGILLLTVGIVPFVVSSLGRSLGGASLLAVSTPAVITGVLYLISAHFEQGPVPPARPDARPAKPPKTA